MRRRISLRLLWRHVLRGLVLCGACAGGSARCYTEWTRANPVHQPSAECWDWSIPHQWYDAAHRH
ncbi:Secreted protein [Nocardia ninae]|uniref:Secreted protein n=1 Tax=Nocardia ninae NBRC 108245 TaxID=1210091 RepID=A0A511MCA4_9NOCA|nr:hypothetical protein NN4_28230 [Nocardia ninae NBRC 108245]